MQGFEPPNVVKPGQGLTGAINKWVTHTSYGWSWLIQNYNNNIKHIFEVYCHFTSPLHNSLVAGRWGCNLKSINFKFNLQNSSLDTECDIALRWMLQNLTNEKSTWVQEMAWCRQATSHCRNQCWPISMSPYHDMTSLGHTELNYHILAYAMQPPAS